MIKFGLEDGGGRFSNFAILVDHFGILLGVRGERRPNIKANREVDVNLGDSDCLGLFLNSLWEVIKCSNRRGLFVSSRPISLKNGSVMERLTPSSEQNSLSSGPRG